MSNHDEKLEIAARAARTHYVARKTRNKIGEKLGTGETLKETGDELSECDRRQHSLLSRVGTIALDGSSNPYAGLPGARRLHPGAHSE